MFECYIEKAKELHLTSIIVETDSLEVYKAFQTSEGVPWQLSARWHNCMQFSEHFKCTSTHVLREGNMIADAMAKNGQGLSMHSSQWWITPPSFIFPLLYRDSLGLSFSRISMD